MSNYALNAKDARRLAGMDRTVVRIYELIRDRAKNRNTSLTTYCDEKVLNIVVRDLLSEGYEVEVKGAPNTTRRDLVISWDKEKP